MAQFEQEIGPAFGLRFTGIQSRALNWYRYENTPRPYSSYSIPITSTDPAPDNVRGNADDPGSRSLTSIQSHCAAMRFRPRGL
jgi:hypothetical protein